MKNNLTVEEALRIINSGRCLRTVVFNESMDSNGKTEVLYGKINNKIIVVDDEVLTKGDDFLGITEEEVEDELSWAIEEGDLYEYSIESMAYFKKRIITEIVTSFQSNVIDTYALVSNLNLKESVSRRNRYSRRIRESEESDPDYGIGVRMFHRNGEEVLPSDLADALVDWECDINVNGGGHADWLDRKASSGADLDEMATSEHSWEDQYLINLIHKSCVANVNNFIKGRELDCPFMRDVRLEGSSSARRNLLAFIDSADLDDLISDMLRKYDANYNPIKAAEKALR